MAKVRNLVSTDIRQFHLSIDDGGVGNVRVLYDVIDETDGIVLEDNYHAAFVDLPANVQASFNNALRMMSREINNSAVEEDSETWVDL